MRAEQEDKAEETESSKADEAESKTSEPGKSEPEDEESEFEASNLGETEKVDEMTDLELQLEEARCLADEWQDQLLRCRAEMDNTLKRVAREKEALSRYAAENLIVKLLPVLDSLDQAVKHDEGLEKIRQQFLAVLQGEGLTPIEAVGEKFDPYKHEALMMLESDEYEEGTVVEEVLRGYCLNSKVIRFSKVLVSKK